MELRGALSRCRSPCGAKRSTRVFPNSAWIRVNRDLFDELRRFKIATGLPTWDAALERLCELAKVEAVNHFAPALDVANAVLYEGYILYPYTASARKNRIRWQFGVIVPEGVRRRAAPASRPKRRRRSCSSASAIRESTCLCAFCKSRRARSKPGRDRRSSRLPR